MSTELVLLAVLMFLVTYPTRALGLLTPGLERLPRQALDYLQLVGPAVLAALAAVSVMVATDEAGHAVVPRRHRVDRGRWPASPSTAWRRNLLLGLIAAVAIVVARAERPGWRRCRADVEAAAARRPRSRRAGSGASAPATATIVAAGRISPKTSPWTADSALGERHVERRTSASGRRRASVNPPSASAALDDREHRPGLAADVARVLRRPVRPGVGRAGDPARVADDDRPAVAGDRLPRPARRDPSTRRLGHPARTAGRRRARRAPPGRARSPAAARRAASSAARSSRPRGTRPASGRCRRSARGRRASARPCPTSCWRRTRRRSRCR